MNKFANFISDTKMSMLLTSDQVLLQAASYPAAKKPRLGLDLNVDISSDPNATLLKTTSTAQISNQGKLFAFDCSKSNSLPPSVFSILY